MTNATLNHLLRISIEGPAIDQFDFDKAVSRWGSLRNRRLLLWFVLLKSLANIFEICRVYLQGKVVQVYQKLIVF